MTLLSPVAVVGHDLAYGAELLSARSIPLFYAKLCCWKGVYRVGVVGSLRLRSAALGGRVRRLRSGRHKSSGVCVFLEKMAAGFPAGEHREVTLDCQRHHVPRAGGGAGRPGLRPPPPPAPPAPPLPPPPPSPPVHRPSSRHPCRSDDPCREL